MIYKLSMKIYYKSEIIVLKKIKNINNKFCELKNYKKN